MLTIPEVVTNCNTFDVKPAAFALSAERGLSFIEHLRAAGYKPCLSADCLFMVGFDVEAKIALLTHPACKRWSCAPCAARNGRRWIARILHGINTLDGIWWMATVTAHERWRGQEKSLKNLRQGWRKLYDRARRKHGTSSYVRVWEHHKDGSFHLHFLVDTNWSERWLKDNARGCGMGYQCEVHEVDNAGQVVGYIAKYFMKQLDDAENGYQWPENLRRVSVSQAWPKLPQVADFSRFRWDVYETRDGQERRGQSLEVEGYRIVDLVRLAKTPDCLTRCQLHATIHVTR